MEPRNVEKEEWVLKVEVRSNIERERERKRRPQRGTERGSKRTTEGAGRAWGDEEEGV